MAKPFDFRAETGNQRNFMNQLRKTGIDCDLDIICKEGVAVKCHNNLLRFHCEHRKWSFDEKLVISEVASHVVRNVVEYFYLGRLRVEQEDLIETLKLCEKLHCTKITAELEAYLPSLNPCGSADWIKF